MYPTPENARPGQELPRKSMIIEQTLYAQKQLAETSDNPKDETKFLTNQMEGNFGMKWTECIKPIQQKEISTEYNVTCYGEQLFYK